MTISSRRTFLRLGAALPLLAEDSGRTRIVVLGAGLAGLTTAFELQNLGYAVTVLEARSRPGGRVQTLREGFAPGLYIEAGAARVPSNHDLTQHYAKLMGLRLLPAAIPGTRGLHYIRQQRQPSSQIDLAGLRKKYIEPAMQQAMQSGFDRDPIGALSEWDKPSLGDWLRRSGATAEEINLLTMGFGQDFGSAAWFLLYNFNLYGSTQSSYVDGGNDQLPKALAARIRDLRYGEPIAAVNQGPNGATVITQRGERIEAGYVVSTIPCPVVGRIFEDARLSHAKVQAIRNQSYSHTAKVFLQTRTRFWLKDNWSGNVTTDLPIERLTPDTGSDASQRGILAVYPIGRFANQLEAMPDRERVSQALAQAKQIFPELAQQFEGAVSKCWGTDPWQRGSFTVQTPGQLRYLKVLAEPEGRIHFAGEHTSRFTGWMQGAFESARRVVAEIKTRAGAPTAESGSPSRG